MVSLTAWCTGKKPYRSAAHAWKVVVKLRRRGFDVTAYRCSSCHRWHIGG